MTVCKFWRAGNCKFGNECRYDHPPSMGPRSQPASKPPDTFMRQPPEPDHNRFGRPNNQNNNNRIENAHPHFVPNNQNQRYSNQSQSRGFRDYRGSRGGRDPQPYGVTRDMLQEDLRPSERPMWIMSAYGPGKDPAIQLFGGYPLEHSPEEVRVMHYQAMAAGNPQQSGQAEAELATISNEQVDAVLNDLSGALHYLNNGSKEHPNRHDICKSGTANIKRNGDGPFSKSTRHREISDQRRALASNGFGGQPSAAGFASQQPGFGSTPPNPQNQAFGIQNTGFNTGFGSQGQNQTSFAQQPQAAQFGPPQNSGFNAQPHPPSGFAPADQSMVSPQMNQPNPTLGMVNDNSNIPQPQQQQPMNSPFGQPQIQQQQPPNTFSNPSQQQQTNQPLFGGPQINQQPQQPQQAFNTGGFGQQPQQAAQSAAMNGFQQPQQLQPNGPGGNPSSNGDVNSYTTRDASNKLLTWKGRPVNYITADEPCYQQNQGSWERIWFPDGEPKPTGAKDNQAGGLPDIEQYSNEAKEAYGFLKENESFKGGIVPDVAPLAEMVRWDV